MAKIVELQRTTFERRSIHDPVASCLYDFYDVAGQPPSADQHVWAEGPQDARQASQVIQVDEAGARRLIAAMREAFPGMT